MRPHFTCLGGPTSSFEIQCKMSITLMCLVRQFSVPRGPRSQVNSDTKSECLSGIFQIRRNGRGANSTAIIESFVRYTASNSGRNILLSASWYICLYFLIIGPFNDLFSFRYLIILGKSPSTLSTRRDTHSTWLRARNRITKRKENV